MNFERASVAVWENVYKLAPHAVAVLPIGELAHVHVFPFAVHKVTVNKHSLICEQYQWYFFL